MRALETGYVLVVGEYIVEVEENRPNEVYITHPDGYGDYFPIEELSESLRMLLEKKITNGA